MHQSIILDNIILLFMLYVFFFLIIHLMSNLYIHNILNFNIFQVKYKHCLYLQIHVQIKQC